MVDLNVPTKEQKETELGYSKRMAEALERIAQSQATGDSLNALCVAMIDGTKAGYDRAMKAWFSAKGAESKSPADLTALVEEWYKITRVPWDGGAEFYQPNVSAVSTGTKYGDNAGMQCTPSTDTVANRDDYAGHPCFACVDVNFTVDAESLEPLITAIDGITSGFERYNPAKFVGVMQMNMYVYGVEGGSTYKRGLTSVFKPYAEISAPFGCKPSDNSFRQYTVHTKYMNHTENGKMTAYAGVPATARSISHNGLISLASATGTGYSGTSITDWAFILMMLFVKYGSLTADGILQGCVANDNRHAALVAETNTQRILIASGQASRYPVGCRILIGTRTSASDTYDRYPAETYSISGADGCKVTAVEEVSIDSSNYTAVYVDCTPFDTVVDSTTPANTTFIRSWHWDNGTCDSVLGNDGSPVSYSSGQYPAKIQGIEYSVGGYETMGDCILKLYQDTEDTSVYYYEPYTVKKTANQATAISSNYVASGIKTKQPSASTWAYITKMTLSKGLLFATNLTGGSSSTFHRDQGYLLAATAGERELLVVGALSDGVTRGGASCFDGSFTLGIAYWHILGRLSPNGNRGELTA